MTTSAHKTKKAAAKKSAPVKKTAVKKIIAAKNSSLKPLPKSCGVRELRQSASKILDQVKDGVVFEITEHGIPVARLVPITKSLYEEYIAAGLIIPAENPNWRFTAPTYKLKGKKTSTELLMEIRAEARY
jgi:prevent-host-death family protein